MFMSSLVVYRFLTMCNIVHLDRM